MKNKKLTNYFLIPAVITIWSIIAYKITIKDDDSSGINSFNDGPKKEQISKENKEYALINNYADPFFHKEPKVISDPLPVSEVVKPKVENVWPTIRFNGYILNGSIVRGHLTVNGEDKILQVNETASENCYVTALTSDSVQLKYLGNSQWFKK